MISVCLIVKNEASILETCLKNISKYFDEIVVVDTGSTDNTKEIAKMYTQLIFDFEWCQNFSEARNFSISKATNNWVLILDADEVVLEANIENLRKMMKQNPLKVGRIKRFNTFELEGSTQRYIERVNRFFDKRLFCYEGIIHEQIVARNGNTYKTFPIEFEVDHAGYMDEVIKKTDKLNRNIELLEIALESAPKDSYLHYQIGKSYYKGKNSEKALWHFKKALDLGIAIQYEYAEDAVESYGYALLKCQKYSKALEIKRYEEFFGALPDFNFLMGLIYMNNAEFDTAMRYFSKCVCEKEGRIEGINSFLPMYNIGVINEALGKVYDALQFYRRADGYVLALRRIDALKTVLKSEYQKEIAEIQELIEANHLDEADKRLKEWRMIDSDDEKILSLYGIIKMIKGDLSESILLFKKIVEKNDKNTDATYNIAFAYECMEDFKNAKEWFEKTLEITSEKELREEIIDHLENLKN